MLAVPSRTADEPEVAIGEMDGPMGVAFGDSVGVHLKGHSRVLAIMNTDIMVRRVTLMVSKVTVKNTRYTNIHREATAKAIHKAMSNEPSIGWLLDNQNEVVHKYYQMRLDGKI